MMTNENVNEIIRWKLSYNLMCMTILKDRYYKIYGKFPDTDDYLGWSKLKTYGAENVSEDQFQSYLFKVASRFLNYTPVDLILTSMLAIEEANLNELLSNIKYDHATPMELIDKTLETF